MMSLRQSLLGLTEYFFSNVTMYNCTHHFNTLTSSSHANFSVDIFYPKIVLHSFWGRENGLKAEYVCKIFSYLIICLCNHNFICLRIAHEDIHLTIGISYSAMNVR